MKNACDLEDM